VEPYRLILNVEHKMIIRLMYDKEQEREYQAISSSAFPGFELRTTVPDGLGYFDFTGAYILASHVEGWNELELALAGRGRFLTNAYGEGTLSFDEAPERKDVAWGRIRLRNSRWTGSEALKLLRDRRERILAGKPAERDMEEAAWWVWLEHNWVFSVQCFNGAKLKLVR
jgi:hypothetical protein